MTEALLPWRDFYTAVAGAGAALIGLVYVGVSIRLGRQPADARIRLQGTTTSQHLVHPLFAALAMLLPVTGVVQGAFLLALSVAGLANTVGTRIFEARHPAHPAGVPASAAREDPPEPASAGRGSRPAHALETLALTPPSATPFMTAYRFLTPLLASLVLAAGAVGLMAGSPVGVYAPPVFVFLMFLVGIENAWALLIGGDAAPPSAAAPPAGDRG